jgi:NMT1/THI5 like/TAT (twin-arginine translocation) pathway signal sequence
MQASSRQREINGFSTTNLLARVLLHFETAQSSALSGWRAHRRDSIRGSAVSVSPSLPLTWRFTVRSKPLWNPSGPEGWRKTMCERDGTFFRNFSRRNFLKSTAASAATIAVPAHLAGMLGAPGSAYAATSVKATHGSGFCNMGIFLAKERNLTAADGVNLEFVVTPSNTEITTMFGAGLVDMSMIPYSNFMTLYDAGAPVKIVAGGGVQGCIIVAREGIKSAADLKGKTFGTFQADTLEVLPYDYLKKAGLTFKDVQIKYLDTSPELAQAFIAGALDAICHIPTLRNACSNARERPSCRTGRTSTARAIPIASWLSARP